MGVAPVVGAFLGAGAARREGERKALKAQDEAKRKQEEAARRAQTDARIRARQAEVDIRRSRPGRQILTSRRSVLG